MFDVPWWKSTVIYQIYPRSFQDSDGDGVGDLRGIAARLPYLVELGIDAIWISPIFPSPMVDFCQGSSFLGACFRLPPISAAQPRFPTPSSNWTCGFPASGIRVEFTRPDTRSMFASLRFSLDIISAKVQIDINRALQQSVRASNPDLT